MVLQLVVNILFNCALNLLLSVSFAIIFFTTKFFHIALAATVTLGAYLTYLFFVQLNLTIILSIVFTIAIVALAGFLCDFILYRILRRKKTNPLALLISSVGIYTVLQNTISLIWGDDVKVIDNSSNSIGHEIFGAYITTIQLITIGVSILIFASYVFLMNISPIGKKIKAVASNPILATIYGIDSNYIIGICFIIGSAISACAGILSAYDTFLFPTMGFNLMLYGAVVMIIAGIGSYWGLLVGSLLLSITQNLVAYYFNTDWIDAIVYLVLIFFLMFRPMGFSGNAIRKIEI